jgi:hypothetical protein
MLPLWDNVYRYQNSVSDENVERKDWKSKSS